MAPMNVVMIGGGIGGMTLGLALKTRMTRITRCADQVDEVSISSQRDNRGTSQ